MSSLWREDDEEFRVEGQSAVFSPKPRFSYNEVKLLLEEVKRNRYILLKKFNQGVAAETKKHTWAEITNQINGLGEHHRQVKQIVKKWADLKSEWKRRMAALRGPNGATGKRKRLNYVEKMVHKILVMSPKAGESLHFSSDLDLAEEGEPSLDFDDDSAFSSFPRSLDPLPDDILPRPKPVHTYSRNSQNQNHGSTRPPPGPSSSSGPDVPSSSAPLPPSVASDLTSSLPAPSSPSPSSSSSSSSSTPVVANGTTSHPEPPSGSTPAPPSAHQPPPSSSVFPPRDPAAAKVAAAARAQERVAQLASQSLQQQRAGRMLLTSVSQSLEALAQSVQLLVESQQELVQESLLLQKETVEVLRDFSNTALNMLRGKAPPPPPPPQHSTPRF